MKKNYWPHFIIGLVIFAIALGVWTVKTAIDNPVELDDTYMMKYQDVDRDIYKITKMKREFLKRYTLVPVTKKLDFPDATFAFKLTDKEGNPIKDAKVLVLFTRPDTSKYDIKKEAKFQNGMFVVQTKLPLKGRWNILLKVDKDNLTYYAKYKYSTLRELPQKLKDS